MNLIADLIEANLEVLVRRFVEETRGRESSQGLKASEIITTLPEYLRMVALICRHGPTPERLETRKRLEEVHINLRLRVGATQEDATDEYTLMGRLIPRLWDDVGPEHKPAASDLQCLFQQLEDAMDHVVVLFSGYSLEDRQREKRFLRQLDALAPQALEAHEDAQARLQPLVDTVIRALEAAGAELFLMEPGSTVMVAVANSGRDVPHARRRRVDARGPSFLGRVTRSEEPLVLTQAHGLPDSEREGLGNEGWSTLLGLRLWPHGKLMGVLCVGFAQARPVTPQTKRFLETLVDYLSSILDRALLMGKGKGKLHETHAQLARSETRYRLATQAASDSVWDWDLTTQEVTWSGGVQDLLGFTPEETGPTADWWVGRIHPEDRERVKHGIHAAIQGTQSRWQDEYRFLTRQGDPVRVLDTGVITRDAQGRGMRMVGAMQDITARRKTEAGREQFLQEAQTARVQASAERALRMIRDLLDFTQARLGGGIPVQCQDLDLDLATVVRQVMEEVQMNFPERVLQTSMPGHEAWGCWDPDRMAQVLTNLLGNALKYSPESTPVTVRVQGTEREVLLEVHNAGDPIPPDLLRRLFQPMQRGVPGMDLTTRSVGLGLYIVQHIVQAHGGTIDVMSMKEAGTTFTVKLPRDGARQATRG
ncbi:ATP-binding protein [Corallococcus sp. bb12-1]|uniref:ATP-binding protein n=1 Tax=Corallococcus sp. bb12-1 TaxID=2996784 RepID=UPI00227162BE|nr:ATP-binding protein [Corallococcus sp. bb12-1]MCY1040386.1 ATP-binding protein [Corallococcus sp. bb12-1]